jgi:hypothetical protein
MVGPLKEPDEPLEYIIDAGCHHLFQSDEITSASHELQSV